MTLIGICPVSVENVPNVMSPQVPFVAQLQLVGMGTRRNFQGDSDLVWAQALLDLAKPSEAP